MLSKPLDNSRKEKCTVSHLAQSVAPQNADHFTFEILSKKTDNFHCTSSLKINPIHYTAYTWIEKIAEVGEKHSLTSYCSVLMCNEGTRESSSAMAFNTRGLVSQLSLGESAFHVEPKSTTWYRSPEEEAQ